MLGARSQGREQLAIGPGQPDLRTEGDQNFEELAAPSGIRAPAGEARGGTGRANAASSTATACLQLDVIGQLQ